MHHYQGFIVFKHPKDFNAVKKLFSERVHIERMRGNLAQNKDYCSKRKSKVKEDVEKGIFSGPWSRGSLGLLEDIEQLTVKDPMEGKTYKDWQQDIVDMVEDEPDERKIFWFWDEKGGIGKSVFTKHMVLKHSALVCNGSSKDMMYFVQMRLKKKKPPKIIIFDIPRAKSKDFLSYVGIEKLKDGCFLSTKYESDMVVYNPPHVIVFANWPPDDNKLSSDRWEIKDITEYKFTVDTGPTDEIFETESPASVMDHIKSYDYPVKKRIKKDS